MSSAAQPWCPWCAYARTCHACTSDRVVAVIYCTCTPLTPQRHHEHECPAAAAQRDGLDVLPPGLWREVVRPEWERTPEGEWRQTGESRWRVPVATLAPCEVVILDTETTGLSDADRVCELAMARVDLATGIVTEEREQLCHPGRLNGAAHINGITDAMLRGCPRLVDLWPKVRAWIGASPVLAHNAAFDRKMLARECPDADTLAWVDTKPWAKRVYPSQTSHGLQPLAAALKLPTGTAHRALGDVRTLAALATRLYAVSGALPASMAAAPTTARPAPASLTLAGVTP